MPYCFMIQPFDKDKYDGRYNDVFKPAIVAAGLDPYRVDQDPKVTIPIESIQDGIGKAAVCLAEITEDNPNVWFELGFAIASATPVCMMRSDERKTEFPFDVKHRNIITYKTGTPSDFVALGKLITASLQGVLKDRSDMTAIVKGPSGDGIEPYELAALTIVVAESSIGNDGGPSMYMVRQGMDKAGFNDLATGLALRNLLQRAFIETRDCADQDARDTYTACFPTTDGIKYLMSRRHELQLTKLQRKPQPKPPEITQADIPF